MAEESTLLIVKPDGVRRGLVGEVLRRAEDKGLRVAEIRSLTIDRPLAEEHYGEHRDKPFFGELVDFITSGPVVVVRLEGEGAIDVWRTMMGPTVPATAPPGTIRGDFGLVDHENLVTAATRPSRPSASSSSSSADGVAGLGSYEALRNATAALWPPNPNEFDSASRTSSSRASFGT